MKKNEVKISAKRYQELLAIEQQLELARQGTEVLKNDQRASVKEAINSIYTWLKHNLRISENRAIEFPVGKREEICYDFQNKFFRPEHIASLKSNPVQWGVNEDWLKPFLEAKVDIVGSLKKEWAEQLATRTGRFTNDSVANTPKSVDDDKVKTLRDAGWNKDHNDWFHEKTVDHPAHVPYTMSLDQAYGWEMAWQFLTKDKVKSSVEEDNHDIHDFAGNAIAALKQEQSKEVVIVLNWQAHIVELDITEADINESTASTGIDVDQLRRNIDDPERYGLFHTPNHGLLNFTGIHLNAGTIYAATKKGDRYTITKVLTDILNTKGGLKTPPAIPDAPDTDTVFPTEAGDANWTSSTTEAAIKSDRNATKIRLVLCNRIDSCIVLTPEQVETVRSSNTIDTTVLIHEKGKEFYTYLKSIKATKENTRRFVGYAMPEEPHVMWLYWATENVSAGTAKLDLVCSTLAALYANSLTNDR